MNDCMSIKGIVILCFVVAVVGVALALRAAAQGAGVEPPGSGGGSPEPGGLSRRVDAGVDSAEVKGGAEVGQGFGDANSVATLVAAIVAGVAAVVAALLSFAGVVITLRAGRSRDGMVAVREAMLPFMSRLAESTYRTLATAHMIGLYRKDGRDAKGWTARGDVARKSLENTRVQVRYVVPGLDRGFRLLARAPMWAQNAKNEGFGFDDVFSAMDELRLEIDRIVSACFVRGRFPASDEVARIDALVSRVDELLPDPAKVARPLGSAEEDYTWVEEEADR